MQINLRGKKVAVEKIKKVNNHSGGGVVIIPESEQFQGIVKYIGAGASSDLQVGQKVYFSTNHQTTRMAGQELCIMEDTEVYAIVQE